MWVYPFPDRAPSGHLNFYRVGEEWEVVLIVGTHLCTHGSEGYQLERIEPVQSGRGGDRI